jgi:hypothetical protein
VDVQESLVQSLPSEQLGADPAVQVPFWHESLTVQPFESALHEVPLALFTVLVAPVSTQRVPLTVGMQELAHAG